tara:strand:- start:4891 stop:5061 length:171 start_codon:yes stop_codon:yes gene_type:complete
LEIFFDHMGDVGMQSALVRHLGKRPGVLPRDQQTLTRLGTGTEEQRKILVRAQLTD